VLEGYRQAPLRKVAPPVVKRDSIQPSSEQYALFLGVSDTLLENASLANDQVRVEPLGDSLYLYSFGTSKNKFDLLEEYREAQELGFPGSRVAELSDDGTLLYPQELAKTPVVEVEHILETPLTEQQIVASAEVFYGYNVYQLTEENKQQLKQLARMNLLTEKHRVLITSFTDSKGDDEYNLMLSQKRSLSVREELIAYGYPAELIETENYGKRVPADMRPLTDAQRRKSLIIIYEKN
jgi:outer membrane protein OmpA-like peptidoglycan-associated protein